MLPGRPPSPRDRAFNGQPKRFAANAAWLELVLIAQDLMAWTRALCPAGSPCRRWAQAAALCPLAHSRAALATGPPADLAAVGQLAMGERSPDGRSGGCAPWPFPPDQPPHTNRPPGTRPAFGSRLGAAGDGPSGRLDVFDLRERARHRSEINPNPVGPPSGVARPYWRSY